MYGELSYADSSFEQSWLPRAPFVGLCLYLGSQAFTIPILAIGNWAVWPSLSDFAWLAFVLLSLPTIVGKPIPDWGITRLLLAILIGSVASYLVLTEFWPVLHDAGTDKGEVVGLYQLYRLVQFLAVFWLAMKVPITAKRLLTLHWLCVSVCTLICLSCIATYSFVSTSIFYGHLMSSVKTSGPWAPFILGVNHIGVGVTSYNHCYTGIQILLLAGLAAHTRRPSLLPPWLAGLSFIAIFVSEHRTGLLFFAIYMILMIRPSAKYVGSCILLTGLAGFVLAYRWSDVHDAFYDAIERHSTIPTSYSIDGFSNRDEIWADRLEFLNADWPRWIVGSGFGSAMESGSNAHMLFLHIIVEVGLLGLFLFIALMGKILYVLWNAEEAPHPLFWVTVCLLGTGLTQETFYPVVAFEHFIGLFLCAVAIAIQSIVYKSSLVDEAEWATSAA